MKLGGKLGLANRTPAEASRMGSGTTGGSHTEVRGKSCALGLRAMPRSILKRELTQSAEETHSRV